MKKSVEIEDGPIVLWRTLNPPNVTKVKTNINADTRMSLSFQSSKSDRAGVVHTVRSTSTISLRNRYVPNLKQEHHALPPRLLEGITW